MVGHTNCLSDVAIREDFELVCPSHMPCNESPSGAIVVLEFIRLSDTGCQGSGENDGLEKVGTTYMERNDVI